MVIVTNWFIPVWADAMFCGFFILIRPEHKDNKALLAHEKEHRRQFFRNPIAFILGYRFSKGRRYELELEAYAVQAKWWRNDPSYNDRVRQYAIFLSDNYGVNKTFDECYADLLVRL